MHRTVYQTFCLICNIFTISVQFQKNKAILHVHLYFSIGIDLKFLMYVHYFHYVLYDIHLHFTYRVIHVCSDVWD